MQCIKVFHLKDIPLRLNKFRNYYNIGISTHSLSHLLFPNQEEHILMVNNFFIYSYFQMKLLQKWNLSKGIVKMITKFIDILFWSVIHNIIPLRMKDLTINHDVKWKTWGISFNLLEAVGDADLDIHF